MIEWIKDELAKEEIFASSAGIAKILANEPNGFEDTVIDIVFALKDEWDAY